MGLLDDTAIFAAIIQQGGFSKAAKHLGLSNGLISRRIAQMEANLGVILIKRTTRQLKLTPEGELFWQHAQRIQDELNSAVMLVQSKAQRPKGVLRIAAPIYYGRHYLTPLLAKFMRNFPEIQSELVLYNGALPIVDQVEQLDLVIWEGDSNESTPPQDTMLQWTLLYKEIIKLYASPHYLAHASTIKSPLDLPLQQIIHYKEQLRSIHNESWTFQAINGKKGEVVLKGGFNCNDVGAGIEACIQGLGVGRFSELSAKSAYQAQLIRPILMDYHWGEKYLYVGCLETQKLTAPTRLLLDFIMSHVSNYQSKVA